MSYRLQMSAEFHDWLAELRDRDPSAAVPVAQACNASGPWPNSASGSG